jgi:hypothetical protein
LGRRAHRPTHPVGDYLESVARLGKPLAQLAQADPALAAHQVRIAMGRWFELSPLNC